jgi:hypothetical protein
MVMLWDFAVHPVFHQVLIINLESGLSWRTGLRGGSTATKVLAMMSEEAFVAEGRAYDMFRSLKLLY